MPTFQAMPWLEAQLLLQCSGCICDCTTIIDNTAHCGQADLAGSGYGNARNQSRGLIFAYAVIAGCNSALVSTMPGFVHAAMYHSVFKTF